MPERAQDRVDRDAAAWARIRPDLDVVPAAAVERVLRLAAFADRELDGTLRRFGLGRAAFDVLCAVRRLGRQHRLLQSQLLGELGSASGTLSVRLGRLERAGLVSRRPDPADRRGVVVELTEAGRVLVDAAVPAYVETAQRLLDPLAPAQRETLAGLLRDLLSAHEGSGDAARAALLLGVTVVPAGRARRLRRSVGLADRPGVLLGGVERGGPAERAGLARGDLVVAVDAGGERIPVQDATDLHAAVSQPPGPVRLTVVRGSQERQVDVLLA